MWSQLLQSIARQSSDDGTLPRATPELLCQVWPGLVGSAIARLSTPARLEDRTLFVLARDQALVDEWKRTPLPLLRRLRQFSPWPIEKLDIKFDPTAGVRDRSSKIATSKPPSGQESKSTSSSQAPIDESTKERIDGELRSLIDAIDKHRHDRES